MTTKELTKDDRTHIARLQALRELGICNMFTEVRHGLIEVYGKNDGLETYQWVQDNFEYYMSGEWTERSRDE